MCRLAGYYLTKKTVTNGNKAKGNLLDLLVQQQSGGTDATGLAFASPKNKFWVHKKPVNATDFVGDADTLKILGENNPRSVIAHCRLKTLGDQSNNTNNHPHFTKGGIITIHNGVITNHDELFDKYKFPRDAEVDSEIIGKMVEMYIKLGCDAPTAIQSMSKEVRGSMALALLDVTQPDTLYLVRRENNLSVAYDKDSGIIYFATDRDVLGQVLIETETYLSFFTRPKNLSRVIFHEVPLKIGLKITKDKIEQFEVETPPWTQPAYNGQGQGWWNKDKKNKKIWCKTHACYYDSPDCKHFNENAVKQDNLKYFIEDEKRRKFWDEGIRHGFVKTQPIKKSSKFTTDEIQARLDYLEELEYDKPLQPKLDTEARRLDEALQSRRKPKSQPIQTPLLTDGESSMKGGDELE